MKKFCLCFIVALAATSLTGLAFAQSAHESAMTDESRSWSNKADVLGSRLAEIEPSAWSQDQQEEYLHAALQAVFFGINAYIIRNHRHPSSINELGLQNVPRNPYNGWRPIELKYDDTTFNAGDVFVQRSPELAYAGRRPNQERISYVAGIFGPSREFQPSGNPVLFEDRYGALSWASVPSGTAYMTMFHRRSAADTDRVRAEQQRLAEEK